MSICLVRPTDFSKNIAPNNPLLRYSYEDHFIMRMGYTFYCSNLNPSNPVQRRTNVYTLRAAGEIAGNVLNAFSKLTSKEPMGDTRFLVSDIPSMLNSISIIVLPI